MRVVSALFLLCFYFVSTLCLSSAVSLVLCLSSLDWQFSTAFFANQTPSRKCKDEDSPAHGSVPLVKRQPWRTLGDSLLGESELELLFEEIADSVP